MVRTDDVIVVGGGIIGMTIAWRLAQRHAKVSVLEAGIIGGEASWAGAGMLAPGGEVDQLSPWSDFALESLRLYPSFVEELQAESGSKIDFRKSGAIELALDEAEWRELEARAARQSALGIVSVPTESFRPGFYGARFYRDDAIVNPRDVMQCLRRACATLGVAMREHEAATAIHSGESVTVESVQGRYSAGSAILAAGAWSSSVPVHVNGQIRSTPLSFPVRGHLLGYQLEPSSLGPIVRHADTYILQRAGGFTIAGSSSERAGFNREIDTTIVADIARRAQRILPALTNPAAWIGFRPATGSLAPEIGRLPDSRVWLAYGHYRNGILLAPAMARRLAAEITQC